MAERSEPPPSQPHDAFVREVYSDLSNAASLLRRQLPASLSARLDWGRLRPESGSFVDETLRQQESDLVFWAPLCVEGEAIEVAIYVLLEHQSTPDPEMPLRLLRYVVGLMQRHVREHGLPLPLVLPIVLYNGRRPWRVPLDVSELVEPTLLKGWPELKRHVPQLRYLLDDLSTLEVEQLADSGLTAYAAIALWALRASVDVGFAEKIGLLARLLIELSRALRGPDAWLTILRYLTYTWGESAVARIDQVLASLPEPAKEQAMTYRDYLIKQGFDDGLERGLERGLEKGREEGARSARRALLALIQLRFGPADEHVRARVEACDVERLESLADAVLAAESIEQLFTTSPG